MDRRASEEENRKEFCDVHGVAGIVRVVEYELSVFWVCTWGVIILWCSWCWSCWSRNVGRYDGLGM